MPQPGKFNHRVYLFNPVIATTPKGDTTYTYNDAIPATGHEIRMSIEPLLGRELLVAKGIREDVTLKLSCWFTPLITALTRIYWYNGYKWVRIEVGSPISPDYNQRELWFYGVDLSR